MPADIVRDTHEAAGHVGRARLSEALLAAYWWPGLRTQVAEEIARCPACQPEHVGGERATELPPVAADRPGGPFLGWSVNLAGPFPPDADGNRYLAIAVDVFTKWVEADAIPNKRAFTTAAWLYDAVVCCWGRPAFVRLDHGSEWEAEFGA